MRFDELADTLERRMTAEAAAGVRDAGLDGELESLRDAWRALDADGRAATARRAERIGGRVARRPPADEQAEAQRALQGLEGLDDVGSGSRLFEGDPEPDALLAHLGLASFRPGQRVAVEAALDGRDSLVVMPTGGGKSLCYQLPGLATSDLTVVVSPLIALMADQYRRLAVDGHPATMIASGLSDQAQRAALEAVGSGAARIVFCSPERFASSSFVSALARRKVALFVVDEAHCVSEWGHDFRPDYLRLRGAIERLGRPPVMAATATATEAVAEEIVARLNLRDPLMVRSGFDRPSLSFDVVPFAGDGSVARKRALLGHVLADAANRPAIVYCGTRRDVDSVSDDLRGAGLAAVAYHAGLAADERASAQHAFMAGDADVVVATNAFGMGVDKADVRSVVHWAIPTSVEAYYQEAGRAGRDGAPARAVLFAMRGDLGRLVSFNRDRAVAPERVERYVAMLRDRAPGDGTVEMDAPMRDDERLCLAVAEQAGALAIAPAGGRRIAVTTTGELDLRRVNSICAAARERGWQAYRAVEAFVSSERCRRRMLLDHFGDDLEGAPDGRCCDVCDPETGLPDPATLTVAARRRKGRADDDAEPLSPADEALFAALATWRRGAADGKPAYTVAHNRTLEDIARLRPGSLTDLGAIRGVGRTFIERWGGDVLEIVADG